MATRRRGEERKYTEGWEEMKGGRKGQDNRRSQGGMGVERRKVTFTASGTRT